MVATLRTARATDDIKTEIRATENKLHAAEVRLSGISMNEVMSKLDPGTAPLANLLGVTPEQVRSGAAFLIAILFEMGGSLTLWLFSGVIMGRRTKENEEASAEPKQAEASEEAQAPKSESLIEAPQEPAAPLIDLPVDDMRGAAHGAPSP